MKRTTEGKIDHWLWRAAGPIVLMAAVALFLVPLFHLAEEMFRNGVGQLEAALLGATAGGSLSLVGALVAVRWQITSDRRAVAERGREARHAMCLSVAIELRALTDNLTVMARAARKTLPTVKAAAERGEVKDRVDNHSAGVPDPPPILTRVIDRVGELPPELAETCINTYAKIRMLHGNLSMPSTMISFLERVVQMLPRAGIFAWATALVLDRYAEALRLGGSALNGSFKLEEADFIEAAKKCGVSLEELARDDGLEA